MSAVAKRRAVEVRIFESLSPWLGEKAPDLHLALDARPQGMYFLVAGKKYLQFCEEPPIIRLLLSVLQSCSLREVHFGAIPDSALNAKPRFQGGVCIFYRGRKEVLIYVPSDAVRFSDTCTCQEATDQTTDRNRSIV